jgi:hypothetical protein
MIDGARVVRAVRKAWQLGPRATTQVIAARLHQKWYERRLRSSALAGTAATDWIDLKKKFSAAGDTAAFFEQIRNFRFDDTPFFADDFNPTHIIEQADEVKKGAIELLGSGKRYFAQMPWHEDFRLSALDPQADVHFPRAFYKDIEIGVGMTEHLHKDIKVAWELSRSMDLPLLGKAYALTGNQEYAQSFAARVNDWIACNPFLVGPNWVCPMDVALRAVNWIWAFQYFSRANTIDESFLKLFISSLHDHASYLENNWEVYDTRTSNHYFSDLVGYFYLCLFLKPLSADYCAQAAWCWQEISKEIDKQFFDEGTDYEGSTAYHRLMTELVYHTFIVAQQFGFGTTDAQRGHFERMCGFIAWCAINKDEMIRVGDDDSGNVLLWGLPKQHYQNKLCSGKKEYTNFGISFFKNSTVHVSLRHHAYAARQPSGHFHNDAGSITVAVHGIPLIVDPGTYLYTPSAIWRNHFRSTHAHSAVMVDDQEQVPLDNRLFALNLPAANTGCLADEPDTLATMHELFKGTKLYRTIKINADTIEFIDGWEPTDGDQLASKKLTWIFMLHPDAKAKIGDGVVKIYHKNKLLLTLESDLEFQIMEAFYAPAYGVKQETRKLVATKVCPANQSLKIIARIAK